MNRKQYLEIRKSGQITLDLVYDYYKIHNKREDLNFPIEQFAQLFQAYVNYGMFNPQSMFEYYDRKFNRSSRYLIGRRQH